MTAFAMHVAAAVHNGWQVPTERWREEAAGCRASPRQSSRQLPRLSQRSR